MIAHDPESIKTMIHRMGEACLQGEQDALSGKQISPGYPTKEEEDAYKIGFGRVTCAQKEERL